jgi:hypothetical protein
MVHDTCPLFSARGQVGKVSIVDVENHHRDIALTLDDHNRLLYL